jgi:signal transduction histidine kinase
MVKRLAEQAVQLAEELAGTRRLHELGARLMTISDWHLLLYEILAAAQQITGADMGNIQVIDEDGALRIEAQHGFSREFLEFLNDVHSGEVAASGLALARRERVVVEDVERSSVFAGTPALKVLLDAGVRAVQSTPMVSHRGALVGMLSTHYRQARQPNERDLRLIDLLARLAADLIERIRVEDQLRSTNSDLARANEDLNQFAFAASHDLQEPLRMITSYSQLLLKNYRGHLDGQAATCVEFISEGTERMERLLADLLAYTRLTGTAQEQSIAAIDLNDVFQKALDNFKVVIEETKAVITSDHLPTIYGQEPHFIQLFQNLIGNALKYRSESAPRVHVSVEAENRFWRIAVSDNGIGIDPEYHKQIFGLFKRLHGKTISGTGMGLAICQRLIDRYGGRIWVESKEAQGATFYFTLPAVKRAAAP